MFHLYPSVFWDTGDIDLTSNKKSLNVVSLSHSWKEMHVNRNCCDDGWHTCTSLFLFVRKDIRRRSCRSPPFRGLQKSATRCHIFKLHLSTGALPPPAGASQQSFGKIQLWNQSFLRFSEKHSKGREHLFLVRQEILHSYTCHRGNKSNICIIRWKLRVRKAGRWGLESSHLAYAFFLYQLILDTWTDLCSLIISAVDAGYYQHPWYQHESIAALQPSFWALAQFCPSFQVDAWVDGL